MLSSPRMLLALGILISSATAHPHETCEEEIARENTADSIAHGCRACKALEVEAIPNCPKRDYHCDSTLRIRINANGLGCSQLRCEDANAKLAVGGDLFKKVTCANKQWKATKGTIATSAVCARKCVPGVCQTLPDAIFTENPTYVPFTVNPPDDNHPCAWGSCADGALAISSAGNQTYPGPAEFYCTGGRTWEYLGEPDDKRYEYVACMKKPAAACPAITQIDLSKCNEITGSWTCADADITPEYFTCPSGSSATMYLHYDGNEYSQPNSRYNCIGTDWVLEETGEKMKDQLGVDTVSIICHINT